MGCGNSKVSFSHVAASSMDMLRKGQYIWMGLMVGGADLLIDGPWT